MTTGAASAWRLYPGTRSPELEKGSFEPFSSFFLHQLKLTETLFYTPNQTFIRMCLLYFPHRRNLHFIVGTKVCIDDDFHWCLQVSSSRPRPDRRLPHNCKGDEIVRRPPASSKVPFARFHHGYVYISASRLEAPTFLLGLLIRAPR